MKSSESDGTLRTERHRAIAQLERIDLEFDWDETARLRQKSDAAFKRVLESLARMEQLAYRTHR